MGPLEAIKPWSMQGVEGVYRFLSRVWRSDRRRTRRDAEAEPDRPGRRARHGDAALLHQTIKKVTEDLDGTALQHRHRRDDGVHQPPDQQSRSAPANGAGDVRAAARPVRAAPRRGTVAGAGAQANAGLRAVADVRPGLDQGRRDRGAGADQRQADARRSSCRPTSTTRASKRRRWPTRR